MNTYTVSLTASELIAVTAAVMQSMTVAERYPVYAKELKSGYLSLMSPLLTVVPAPEINEYEEEDD